jgi:hypothetical protein
MESVRIQSEDGGSKPTYPLHSLYVVKCGLDVVKSFVEKWHYSHSVFGVTTTVCFAVIHEDVVVGAAIFGLPAGTGVYEKYSDHGKHKLLELRRFCLIDDLPKNAETRTLGVMLRQLRYDGYERILSYADPAYGHQGTIYKAAGFTLLGKTNSRKHWTWKGKKYPDRNIHQIHFKYHIQLRSAIAFGEATPVKIPGKLIYLRNL